MEQLEKLNDFDKMLIVQDMNESVLFENSPYEKTTLGQYANGVMNIYKFITFGMSDLDGIYQALLRPYLFREKGLTAPGDEIFKRIIDSFESKLSRRYVTVAILLQKLYWTTRHNTLPRYESVENEVYNEVMKWVEDNKSSVDYAVIERVKMCATQWAYIEANRKPDETDLIIEALENE